MQELVIYQDILDKLPQSYSAELYNQECQQIFQPDDAGTRGHGDTGTRSGMCPKPRVRGDKPQGSSSPIKSAI
ncbi:MAG: hypothetical protein QNJ51_00485 [Calothrix sp. MO_167.B12]|nr:hypothetical protein [Calothrix sp. MO_167.B12]